MLQLPADLRLLDEALRQLGLARVRLEEHLDGQVASQVEIPTFEDGAHAAAGDLAVELQAAGGIGPAGIGRHLRGARQVHRRDRLSGGLAQLDTRHFGQTSAERVQHAAACRRQRVRVRTKGGGQTGVEGRVGRSLIHRRVREKGLRHGNFLRVRGPWARPLLEIPRGADFRQQILE